MPGHGNLRVGVENPNLQHAWTPSTARMSIAIRRPHYSATLRVRTNSAGPRILGFAIRDNDCDPAMWSRCEPRPCQPTLSLTTSHLADRQSPRRTESEMGRGWPCHQCPSACLTDDLSNPYSLAYLHMVTIHRDVPPSRRIAMQRHACVLAGVPKRSRHDTTPWSRRVPSNHQPQPAQNASSRFKPDIAIILSFPPASSLSREWCSGRVDRDDRVRSFALGREEGPGSSGGTSVAASAALTALAARRSSRIAWRCALSS